MFITPRRTESIRRPISRSGQNIAIQWGQKTNIICVTCSTASPLPNNSVLSSTKVFKHKLNHTTIMMEPIIQRL